jgi:hypothetical protein
MNRSARFALIALGLALAVPAAVLGLSNYAESAPGDIKGRNGPWPGVELDVDTDTDAATISVNAVPVVAVVDNEGRVVSSFGGGGAGGNVAIVDTDDNPNAADSPLYVQVSDGTAVSGTVANPLITGEHPFGDFYGGLLSTTGLNGAGSNFVSNYSSTNGYAWAIPPSGKSWAIHAIHFDILHTSALTGTGFCGAAGGLTNGILVQVVNTAGTSEGAWSAADGSGGTPTVTISPASAFMATNGAIALFGETSVLTTGRWTVRWNFDRMAGSPIIVPNAHAIRVRMRDNQSTSCTGFQVSAFGHAYTP